MITRIVIFLISYGLIVVTASQMIFYINYRSLGYSWDQVLYYILRTPDLKLFVAAAVTLVITVAYRAPLRAPFSEE